VRLRVLGSCAGGGLPQWNCGGANAVRARAGDPDFPPRSQASLALSADGARWSLLGASPDLRDQLARFPGLHPRPGTRDLPLDTVLLANAELDHVLGLLVLRDALSFRILSTAWVRESLLEHNAAFRLLAPVWSSVPLDQPFALDRDGRLEARLFPLPARVPGHLAGLAKAEAGVTVGVRVNDGASRRRLVVIPSLTRLEPGALAELEAADCRVVDGTFFSAHELRELRPGAPDAFAMGHVPIGGSGGSLERLAKLPGRTLYFHLNGTNPVLDPASPEAAAVHRAGIEIASDGQELEA
jgi:pyrroloquinoline quinone biosynthesis protein B